MEESRAEEQRKRDGEAQILTLPSFLKDCHSLSLAIDVTDPDFSPDIDVYLTPPDLVYPRRIVSWVDFPEKQEDIWNRVSELSLTTFLSRHQEDWVRSVTKPIANEDELILFERLAVEKAVRLLIRAVLDNPRLRDRLGLRGTVTWEHREFWGRSSRSEEVSEEVYQKTRVETQKENGRKRKRRMRPHIGFQYSIYRSLGGSKVPTTAIEYKMPHMLDQDEVITGLASEIQPGRDVIGKDCNDFASASRTLTAAVVTELFARMVDKGLQYGYICTGHTFIFLHIPDDPSIVYYHVSVPKLDVLDGDDNRLHRTAVAQLFAFAVQALVATPPPLSWHDAAADLDVWAFKYDDLRNKIPDSVLYGRKHKCNLYQPRHWPGFTHSPASLHHQDDAASSSNSSQQKNETIYDRSFCTHYCLLGLAHDWPVAADCPNAESHPPRRHLGREEFNKEGLDGLLLVLSLISLA